MKSLFSTRSQKKHTESTVDSDFDVLNLCKIESLINYMKIQNKSLDYIGSMGHIFHQNNIHIDRLNKDDFFLKKYHNTVFSTSPEFITDFITGYVTGSYSKIKDSFLFTMPYYQKKNKDLQIIWDSNYSDTETSTDGTIYRWYTGTENTGYISILNTGSHQKLVRVNFAITVLNTDCYIHISTKDRDIKQLNFKENSWYTFDETITVYPGINSISFDYFGDDTVIENDIRILKYAINNLKIEELTSPDTCYSIEEIYCDTIASGTKSYNFYIPDEMIRKTLHKNGFFEISSVLFPKSGILLPLQTTRYDYKSDSLHQDGYYIVNPDPYEDPLPSGVILYTAHRKGVKHET